MSEPNLEPGVEGSADLALFHRAARFLRSILNVDELLRAILEEGLQAVGGTRGFVAQIDRATGDLVLRFTAGAGWDEEQRHRRIRVPVNVSTGQGISAYVARTGVPYSTGNTAADPHYLMYFPDVCSEIAVPLVDADGRTTGVLNLESQEADAFGPRDLQLLVALAAQASIALRVADYRARESALIEVGNDLASATDMDELLQRVVTKAAEVLNADDCSLFLLNPDGTRLVLRASCGLLAQRQGEASYHMGEGLTGWVAEFGQPVRVDHVQDDPRWRGRYTELPAEAIGAFLAVPIRHRGDLRGVLRVVRERSGAGFWSNAFNTEDEVLLTTLAGQVAVAIHHQLLIDRLVHAERMAAWGEMSARSAHMIGNKIFAFKGQINELEYLLQQSATLSDEAAAVLARSRNSVFRLEEILGEFRDFILATQLNRQPANWNAVVRQAVEEGVPQGCGIALRLELDEGLPPVHIDVTKIHRAFSEILENAVNQMGGEGEIRVCSGPWTGDVQDRYPEIQIPSALRGRPAVWAEFADRGPGVPVENKARLFTPYFTTRARGMGLGLSIVKGVVDAHGGAIGEVGRPGEGARFIIVMPAIVE